MFKLALRQAVAGRKVALLIILSLLPLGLAALLDSVVTDAELVGPVIRGVIVPIVLPLVVMLLATSAFGNELEDRTLSLLATRPVSRWTIVLAKIVATVAVTGPLMFAVAAIVAAMDAAAAGNAPIAAGVGALVGVLAYTAIFTWGGLLTTRALGFALIYVLVWEGLLLQFLSNLQYVSVRSYMLGTMRGLDETTFESVQAIDLSWALGAAAAVTAVFFLLTVRRLSRMDIS